MTANNRKAWQRGSLLSLLIVPILSVPAFAVPTERTTTYTYQPPGGNGAGLIATMDGPRTGLGDTTTYTYNSAGNLQIIDNALHYTIQLLDYNNRRRPQRVIDENGVVTLLGYHTRGWLNTITVKDPGGNVALDAITTLTYNDAGLITRITQPNGAYFGFEYDNAQRVKAVVDALKVSGRDDVL